MSMSWKVVGNAFRISFGMLAWTDVFPLATSFFTLLSRTSLLKLLNKVAFFWASCLKDEVIWTMIEDNSDYTIACWGVVDRVVTFWGWSLEGGFFCKCHIYWGMCWRCVRIYDWGEPTVSYKWTGWVWINARLKFKTPGKLPIISE